MKQKTNDLIELLMIFVVFFLSGFLLAVSIFKEPINRDWLETPNQCYNCWDYTAKCWVSGCYCNDTTIAMNTDKICNYQRGYRVP